MSQSPFGVHPSDRVAVFIDGPNFYNATKTVGADVDYRKLRDHLEENCRLVHAYYYTAVKEGGEEEYSPIKPLIDWLKYNGYNLRTKPLKEFEDETGRKRFKGSMTTQMVVDAMEIVGSLDHMILFSGDGEFQPLVEAAQRRGVRVTVVSTMKTNPPMVADELRSQCDAFLDIKDLQAVIGRQRVATDRGGTLRMGPRT